MTELDKGGTYSKPRNRLLYRLTQKFIICIFKVFFGLKVEGRENVPKSGPFILASNHQSWSDPPMIGSSCPREIFYAAKKELFNIFILGSLVRYYNSIPVRRSGFDRVALVKLGEALESGNGIIIFPEGTRFKDGKLHSPKLGVGMLALKYDVPIVPVYSRGSANIRFQLFKRNLRLRFGKPFTLYDIGLSAAEGKDGYKAVADETMRRIAAVGGVSPPEDLKKHTNAGK